MPEGPLDPRTADAEPSAGSGASRDRIEALISAARDLSDTCADLADELRPDAGSDGSPADQAAALLDEAASAVRSTLGLLGRALEEIPAEPHPTVAIPAQAAVVQDPFTGPSPWAGTAPGWPPTPDPAAPWTAPAATWPPGEEPQEPNAAAWPPSDEETPAAASAWPAAGDRPPAPEGAAPWPPAAGETPAAASWPDNSGVPASETAAWPPADGETPASEAAAARHPADGGAPESGAAGDLPPVPEGAAPWVSADGEGADVLPSPRAMGTTWPDAFQEPPSRSVPEEDLIAASRMDRYGGAEIGASFDEREGLAAVPAALAGWMVVDEEAGGEPVALEHRPTGPSPATPVAAASAAGPTMLTVSTDDPYADELDPYGEAASPEPRSLTLVPPLPPGEAWDEPEQGPVSALPPPVDVPAQPPAGPDEAAAPPIDVQDDTDEAVPPRAEADLEDPAESAAPAEAPAQPLTDVPDDAPGAPVEAPAQPLTDVPDDAPGGPLEAPAEPPDDGSYGGPDDGWSVWSVEPVAGASPFGDGVPVFPLDDPEPEPASPDVPMTPTEAALPPEPVDDPSAATVARQVEAARRHLQAALVVANKGDKLGALLTAVEQALTAVTDLARETRGVLPECLSDRTFPGEARFLCSAPWETVELVGREAYGGDVASPAGLAKLLRALGYDAESVTSASGVTGVQIREERYAAHVALVEPAGGGRQRWSGALEWADAGGASRTWAETLGPAELAEDELARRVDELLRRSVGAG